jgi:hypothetical protein
MVIMFSIYGTYCKMFPSQVHVALPFTSTLHVPLFSQGLLSHGETRNKNGKKCYYSESNTRTTFRGTWHSSNTRPSFMYHSKYRVYILFISHKQQTPVSERMHWTVEKLGHIFYYLVILYYINVILISMVIKIQYWLLSNFDICLCSSNVS